MAVRIGDRLKAARKEAGLTQQQLAGDRYTKAYISALEHAHIRPSMVALEYLAGRLGTSAARLIEAEDARWRRLDADLLLAAGQWQAAADAYGELLESSVDRGRRAELLRGLAEAEVRLGHGPEAERAASESVELFERLGREADAALASYWLSAALYGQDNSTEAKAILHAVLGRVRSGLQVEPGFKLRLVMAIATNEAREGNHKLALTYLEEIRALADTLDDRRRATFMFDLAYSYRATGDLEGALRAGYASLALFDAMEARAEVASTQNDLALAHLGMGNVARAEELAAGAHQRLSELKDERQLAHVVETQAQIAAARKRWPEALQLANDALAMAQRADNPKAAVSALLTIASTHAALADGPAALTAFERAATIARQLGRPALLRRV
ncbi:MAG TPA: helix-turn-helix transcriptional regulator, partial [Candidatus Limnocylindrales bacterium]